MSDLSISRRRRRRAVTAVARSALAVVGIVTVFACGACSSDPDPEPTTTQSTVVATPSVSPTTPSSTTVSPPSPTSESAVPTQASGPWPPVSTPEEQEAAKAAIAAFVAYTEVLSAAQQAPQAQDWESAIREVATSAAAAEFVNSIESLAQGGVHQVNAITFEPPRATRISGNSVTVVSCADYSEVTLEDANGNPVELPVGPARRLISARLDRANEASGWLISQLSGGSESTAC
jgi:hypothetical protein